MLLGFWLSAASVKGSIHTLLFADSLRTTPPDTTRDCDRGLKSQKFRLTGDALSLLSRRHKRPVDDA